MLQLLVLLLLRARASSLLPGFSILPLEGSGSFATLRKRRSVSLYRYASHSVTLHLLCTSCRGHGRFYGRLIVPKY